MAYLIDGIVYMPVQVPVQAVPVVQTSQQTDTSELIRLEAKSTQTDGLRRPIDLGTKLASIVQYINQFPSLQCRVLQYGQYGEQKAIEISRLKADLPPERGGPMSMAHITITHDLTVKFCVAGELVNSGTILCSDDTINWEHLKTFIDLISDTHIFCAGISKAEFKSVCVGIRYEPKCLISKSYPFERYTAKRCMKWFKLRKNATKDNRIAAASGDSRCSACNKVYREVRQRNKHQLPKLTHEARKKRTEATSTYPVSLLSPRGVKRKLHSLSLEKKRRKKTISVLSDKLKKLTEVTLDEEQSSELCSFVTSVTDEQLNDALSAEKTATAEALKAAFLHDQKRNSKSLFIIPLIHKMVANKKINKCMVGLKRKAKNV
jgi:hypothetical protein